MTGIFFFLWTFERARHTYEALTANGGTVTGFLTITFQMKMTFQTVEAFHSQCADRAAFYAEQAGAVAFVKAGFFAHWFIGSQRQRGNDRISTTAAAFLSDEHIVDAERTQSR